MLNLLAYANVTDACVVKYPTDVKSAGFQSHFQASQHTDES